MNTKSQLQNALSVVFVVWGILGSSAARASDEGNYFLCKLHGDVRTVRMHRDKDESGNASDGASSPEVNDNCRVEYTKAGQDHIIANAKSTSFCQTKMDELKATLQKAGWTCRNISHSVIHRDQQAAEKGKP